MEVELFSVKLTKPLNHHTSIFLCFLVSNIQMKCPLLMLRGATFVYIHTQFRLSYSYLNNDYI